MGTKTIPKRVYVHPGDVVEFRFGANSEELQKLGFDGKPLRVEVEEIMGNGGRKELKAEVTAHVKAPFMVGMKEAGFYWDSYRGGWYYIEGE